MEHVWRWDEWQGLQLGEVWKELYWFSKGLKPMGEMTVSEMCCLAKRPWTPVGIYIFMDRGSVAYVGKTHGRSFQERMLSHLDHRTPIPGSPHLAQFVQSLVKREHITAAEAVCRLLSMKMVWMPIPISDEGSAFHKTLIAAVERRLLWHGCLDPRLNSERVKHNDYFTLKGNRYQLSPETILGDTSSIIVPEVIIASIGA